MHVHMSLWKDGTNLFFDPKGYALLSDNGALVHRGVDQARGGAAGVRAPKTNSYRRLVPATEGADQPALLRSVTDSVDLSHPVYSKSPKAKRGGVPGPRSRRAIRT